MAIDTREKRGSVAFRSGVFLGRTPTGSISASDRRNMAGFYSGLPSEEAPTAEAPAETVSYTWYVDRARSFSWER